MCAGICAQFELWGSSQALHTEDSPARGHCMCAVSLWPCRLVDSPYIMACSWCCNEFITHFNLNTVSVFLPMPYIDISFNLSFFFSSPYFSPHLPFPPSPLTFRFWFPLSRPFHSHPSSLFAFPFPFPVPTLSPFYSFLFFSLFPSLLPLLHFLFSLSLSSCISSCISSPTLFVVPLPFLLFSLCFIFFLFPHSL